MKSSNIMLLCILGLLISGAVAASSDNGKVNQFSQGSISLEAFKGSTTTDLIIHVPSEVTEVKKIQVKAYYTDGSAKFTRNFFNLTAVNGAVLIQFDDLMRGEQVDVNVHLDKGRGEDNSTVVLLRPDLAVSSASYAEKVVAGDTLQVNATIHEMNLDAGAEATVVLMKGESVLDTMSVNVAAGGTANAVLSAVLPSRGEYNLSLRIIHSIPSEYDEANNVYNFKVIAVSPDLAVTNVVAPAYAGIGQGFEVVAELRELYGDSGAIATVALLDDTTVLESKSLEVRAGSTINVTFNGSLATSGTHVMTVRILESVPQDFVPENNGLSFEVVVKKSPEPVLYALKYYYQNTSLNTSRSISDNGYAESGNEQVLIEEEMLSLTVSSNRSMSFPLRFRINITGETGEGDVIEEKTAVPTTIEGSKKTFTKYYNETNTLLTLSVDETGTALSIESKANASVKISRGYIYWWFKGTQEWDIATNSSSGRLIRASKNLQVSIEVEDRTWFSGGSAVVGITNESYTGGWVDITAGRFEEQRSVWIYSGNSSGETVI